MTSVMQEKRPSQIILTLCSQLFTSAAVFPVHLVLCFRYRSKLRLACIRCLGAINLPTMSQLLCAAQEILLHKLKSCSHLWLAVWALIRKSCETNKTGNVLRRFHFSSSQQVYNLKNLLRVRQKSSGIRVAYQWEKARWFVTCVCTLVFLLLRLCNQTPERRPSFTDCHTLLRAPTLGDCLFWWFGPLQDSYSRKKTLKEG